MAESTGFQHFTVVPADEEEIVIQAGARRAAAAVPAAEAAVEEVVRPATEVVAAAVAAEPVTVPAPAPAPSSEPGISPEDAKAEAQLAHLESSSGNFSRALHEAIAEERVGKPAREGWHETTLEDLESTPMSPMQKIILSVLLGFLVLFGLYCLLRFGLHLF